jgi:pimeloyl-ACP methyl ester carboxylesterase
MALLRIQRPEGRKEQVPAELGMLVGLDRSPEVKTLRHKLERLDYGVEPDDPARIVPNPERRRLDKEIAAVRQELAKLQRDYGAAAMEHQESKRPTLRGFKVANDQLGQKIRAARIRLDALMARKATMAARIAVGEAVKEPIVKLAMAPVGVLFTAESLAKIRVPVAVYAGAKDRWLVPRFHAMWVAKNLPGAELHMVPNAWHFAFMDTPSIPIQTPDGDIAAKRT